MDTPKQIGKYEIKRLLGEGAMGTVYEGYDTDIQRQVAIKTLHLHLINDADGKQYLARFKREAQLAASCIHPNIVLILEYGSHQNRPYIVMEYIRGRTLQSLLKSNAKITLRTAITITAAILKALHVAHLKGIVHRDIKPANVMLTTDKQIKLADFGIARSDGNNEFTRAGAVLGTPKYMPREQLLGEAVDCRADLYAICMIFAELLGRTDDGIQVPLSALNIDDPSLEKKLGSDRTYPSVFVPIIERGLRNNPKQRFQTAKELLTTIRNTYATSPKETTANVPTVVATSPVTNYYDTGTLAGNSGLSFLDMAPERIQAIESDLTTHIGDDAVRILRQELANAISLAEAIYAVAANIPQKSARKKFISRWSN